MRKPRPRRSSWRASGETKAGIKAWVERTCGYDLSNRLDDIRPRYVFDDTCQGTVPAALVAFLESTDYEDAVRKAVSLGGDADTFACITGGIAEAHYGGVPAPILQADHRAARPPALGGGGRVLPPLFR